MTSTLFYLNSSWVWLIVVFRVSVFLNKCYSLWVGCTLYLLKSILWSRPYTSTYKSLINSEISSSLWHASSFNFCRFALLQRSTLKLNDFSSIVCKSPYNMIFWLSPNSGHKIRKLPAFQSLKYPKLLWSKPKSFYWQFLAGKSIFVYLLSYSSSFQSIYPSW